MADQKLETLKETAMFSHLSNKHLELIGRVTDRVSIKPGTTLLYQDQVATHMSIIISGAAEVEVDGTIIATLGAGDAIGEFAMFDNQPASATVKTSEETVVWHIGRAGFIPVYEKNPDMAGPMLLGVIAKLRETNKLVAHQ